MELVRRSPPPTEQELARAVLEAQEYLHSLGITAWQDAIVGTGQREDAPPPFPFRYHHYGVYFATR